MKKRNQKIALVGTISTAVLIILLVGLALLTRHHAKAKVQPQANNTQVYSSISGNVASTLQHQLEVSKKQIAEDISNLLQLSVLQA